MSFKGSDWALKADVGNSSTRRLVLLMLGMRADDWGFCYPSQALLQEETCLGRSTISRALHELAESGLISIYQKRDRKGLLKNLYKLHMPVSSSVEDLSKYDPCHRIFDRARKCIAGPDCPGYQGSPPPVDHVQQTDMTCLGDRHVHVQQTDMESSVVESSIESPPVVPQGDPFPNSKDIEEAIRMWYRLAERYGLPKPRIITGKRRGALKARLKQCGSLDEWRRVLLEIPKHDWMLGKGDRKWVASLDFVLQESSFLKILEGAYGSGGSSKPRGHDVYKSRPFDY